jgi:CheY-like chemotaxis protein
MKSILLVDDSKFQRTANMRSLTRAGYRVMVAGDGEEAISLASHTPPDMIFLDLMLPKMSGVDVLKALKGSSTTASIPVVVLSGLSNRNEAKLLEEGAVAYFEKSKFEGMQQCEALLHVVERVIGK